MRSNRLIALLLVVLVAVVALLAVRDRSGSAEQASTGSATLLGDSLNVGVERHLRQALPGWRLDAHDLVGRTTPQGLEELITVGSAISPYVVVSLGTNDSQNAVDSFRADVARALRLIGPERCIVWATIWRDGAASEGFNRVLREAAEGNRRLRLVDWASLVQAHPEWLAPDGLHGSEAGYRARAAAIAEAMRSCAPGRAPVKA